jgi:hypothetical protein
MRPGWRAGFGDGFVADGLPAAPQGWPRPQRALRHHRIAPPVPCGTPALGLWKPRETLFHVTSSTAANQMAGVKSRPRTNLFRKQGAARSAVAGHPHHAWLRISGTNLAPG